MSARHAYLRRARHWIANRGWRGLLDELLWRARLVLAGKPLPGRPGPETGPYPFDTQYGVDTAGLIWSEALGSAGDPRSDAAAYWATGYYGIAPSVFDAAFRRLLLPFEEFTFVDIGCGKGRALLLALRWPFREAIGVELAPELAAIAQSNLACFRAPWRNPAVAARVVIADATTFSLPRGPLLLYLYHPFAAPVMQRFVDHLRRAWEAEPRPIYVLYVNPELAAIFDAQPFLQRIFDGHFSLNAEESKADRFGSYDERIIAYGPRSATADLPPAA